MASYTKVILFILALAFLAKAHPGCTHDKEYRPPAELQDVDEDMSALQDGRILASTSTASYPNMRLYAVYDTLDDSPSDFKAYVQNVAPAVLRWFSGALRVKYPVSGNIQVSASSVCDLKTPAVLQQGVPADFVVLFHSYSENSGTVASSRACTRASGTKRPLVAHTNFNRHMFVPTTDVIEHEKNMYLLIHEMMHSLGISDNHYEFFLDLNGNPRKGHVKSAKLNGKSSTVIDIPELTQKLRNFYGCSSVPGIFMENDGGSGTAGSHFERRLHLYDVMCSGGIYGRRVSEFTLSFLEGTGWYAPNYKYAEPFFFGQGQGCGFITDSSSNAGKYDEYCTSSSIGCAPQGIGGGKCESDSKTSGFKYVDPRMEYHCENPAAENRAKLPNLQVFGRGLGSKCFTGTLGTSSSGSSTSFCFTYNCVGSGSSTVLEVNVGDQTVVCNEEGVATVSGYRGAINCPDPLRFCNTVGKQYCPRNCMNRGTCVDNQCECYDGFTGVDCGLIDDEI